MSEKISEWTTIQKPEKKRTQEDLFRLLTKEKSSIKVIPPLIDKEMQRTLIPTNKATADFNIEDSHLSNTHQSPLSFDRNDLIDLCQDEDLLQLHKVDSCSRRAGYRKSVTGVHSKNTSHQEIPEDSKLTHQKNPGRLQSNSKALTSTQLPASKSPSMLIPQSAYLKR